MYKHPKPHEIFHLPLTASQADIKSRCTHFYICWDNLVSLIAVQDFDLVRAHHPDSALCSHISPTERHARFQAISAAYDHLRGENYADISTPSSYDDQLREEIGRRTRHAHYRRAEFGQKPSESDHAADIVPIIFGGLVSGIPSSDICVPCTQNC
jgi:hypothetical protein